MEKTVKDIISIKVDNEPFMCFVMDNGTIFIEEKIKKFLTAEKDLKGTIASTHSYFPVEINGKKAYLLTALINHLRPRILKQLAGDGFLYRIDKAIGERDNPKERGLSEFDRMMLKAVHYNPKEQGI